MGLDYHTLKHIKGKHLTQDERVLIHRYALEGMSNGDIAKLIGCAKNTVRNESRRIKNFTGKAWENYSAKESQAMYLENRSRSRKDNKIKASREFLEYLYKHFNGYNKWSIDATCGRAQSKSLFTCIPCSRTVYNWIKAGAINIKYHELPEAYTRKARIKKQAVNEYKNHLGESIEKRPEVVSRRCRFGDWEIDTVIGKKAGQNCVLLTLTERLTRYDIVRMIPSKTKEAVNAAVKEILSMYSEKQADVFKTITADNGLEFAGLGEFDSDKTSIYFAHPYASYERGTNERHNKIIRRFIPKGVDMNKIPGYVVDEVEEWMNALPRRLLGYHTPEELFDQELDNIYSLNPERIIA